MLKKSLVLILGFTLLLSACTTGRSTQSQKVKFHCLIDSICSETAHLKKKYILLPGNKGTNPEDLQFKEYAKYIHRVLQPRGYEQVTNPEEAQIAIFLAYGIGEPKEHQYTYNVPTWGQTGISSGSTYGTIYNYGGMSTYSGTTTYQPQYGITGSRQITGSYITYTRYMVLDAYDFEAFRESQKSIQVWRTNVISTGRTGDLRAVFPYLATASMYWIGENSGRTIESVLDLDDERVRKIQYGN
jgi:hypothetical protein